MNLVMEKAKAEQHRRRLSSSIIDARVIGAVIFVIVIAYIFWG